MKREISLPDYIIIQGILICYWVLRGLCMCHRAKIYCNTRHLCFWVLRRMYMSQHYVGLYYYKRLNIKTLYTSDII